MSRRSEILEFSGTILYTVNGNLCPGQERHKRGFDEIRPDVPHMERQKSLWIQF